MVILGNVEVILNAVAICSRLVHVDGVNAI